MLCELHVGLFAQLSSQFFFKRFPLKWLWQVSIETFVLVHARSVCAGVSRQTDDLAVAALSASLFTYTMEAFDAVHAGHLMVHQNDVVMRREGFGQRILSVCGRFDCDLRIAKELRNHLQVHRRVIDCEHRNARGLVLEAKLDKGRGPVATILVQKGTLKQGDFIACGSAYGRVRAMNDEKGRRLHKATPSMPAEIIGLSSVPGAGEVLVALDSDKEAKAFAATFVSEEKKNKIEETRTQMSLEQLYEQIKEGNLKELPIVVKADVQGSVEALRLNLTKLSNEEVVVKVIHGGVGAISESDIALASASNAIVIGFNVRPDATAKAMAEAQKVDVHTYSVIYEAIGDVERALKGMRAAVYEEKILGHAEIRQIFRSSSTGNIAGAYVRDGILQRGCKVRVFRGEEKLYEGQLASLKRFKDDVKEVREGFECGRVFDGFGDFEIEDRVEAYIMVQVEQD